MNEWPYNMFNVIVGVAVFVLAVLFVLGDYHPSLHEFEAASLFFFAGLLIRSH